MARQDHKKTYEGYFEYSTEVLNSPLGLDRATPTKMRFYYSGNFIFAPEGTIANNGVFADIKNGLAFSLI